ncbi:4732_t:CDS:2 [Diversispora eburnea]|uniref:4732_t:CDS:1 n=1 Tax=Diversispora eburnea TaxID=1213867 RepID=A0A9N8YM29_9GLOM|nr:4732_t:CDS:2 [Diversispora eburnea]
MLPLQKKRIKQISQNQQYSKIITLGLQNGSNVIYSPTHGDAIKTLNMNIVEWDLEKENVISKWKLDAQTCRMMGVPQRDIQSNYGIYNKNNQNFYLWNFITAYTLDDNARSLSMSKANTALVFSEIGL